VKTEQQTSEVTGSASQAWRPFDILHREVDRLFEDFGRDFWRSPFRRSAFNVDRSGAVN